MENLDQSFYRLASPVFEVTEDEMAQFEQFIILMYSRTSELFKVNEAREKLFA